MEIELASIARAKRVFSGQQTGCKLDARYTIARECIGQPRPAYVARFCGDHLAPGTVAHSPTREGAQALATAHRLAFCDAAGIEP